MTEAGNVSQLRELVEDIERVKDVSGEAIPGILTHLAAIQTALAARLAQRNESQQHNDAERLLTVEEAATKLGVAPDWLYRRSPRLPFTVKLGRALRFSQSGIDRWIRSKSGK